MSHQSSTAQEKLEGFWLSPDSINSYLGNRAGREMNNLLFLSEDSMILICEIN
jgi:hypothetical protein